MMIKLFKINTSLYSKNHNFSLFSSVHKESNKKSNNYIFSETIGSVNSSVDGLELSTSWIKTDKQQINIQGKFSFQIFSFFKLFS